MLEIIQPGDSAYESVRHVYVARGRPRRVMLPRNSTEVIEALAIARSDSGGFAVRSGGHGISSIATNDGGSVIDLSRLNDVKHTGGDRVRIGPGARWGAVARSLYPWGLAITSGDSGDVGVGGLATTGGIGLLSRLQGLTIDRLRAAELVTADGRLLSVSELEQPDLLWAIRGAGANVGIVTSFDFEAGRVPDVVRADGSYDLARPIDFLRSWGQTVEQSPREVSAFLYVGAGARPFAQATIVYAGTDRDRARKALQPFARLPGSVRLEAAVVAYPEVPMTTGAGHHGQQTAASHSGLVDHLDDTVAVALETLLASGAAQMVQIRSVGGAVNDIKPEATAYAHRHQNFAIAAMGAKSPRFDDEWAQVRLHTEGMYLSFESAGPDQDVTAAFPPATLERLRTIKAAWDPEGVFTQNFGIR